MLIRCINDSIFSRFNCPDCQESALQSQLKSFSTPGATLEKANEEAKTFFLADRITLSGLTSDEGIHIMGAFLTLPEMERRALLELSQEDLANCFKEFEPVNGNVEHMKSPKDKGI